jgi:cullin-associated NEDD8-dissociated protein 1
LGQLIKIIGDSQMTFVVDNLIEFLGGKDDELRDISGLGMQSSHSQDAETALTST